MAGEEETFNSQLKQTQTTWKEDLERGQSRVDELQTKLSEASNTHETGKDSQKEVNLLWRRVKTTTTLLTYLETKARFVDKVNLPVFDSREVEALIADDERDGSYMGGIINSVKTVGDVMEILIKRVRVAESETSDAKRKVSTGQEEIKRKAVQIETMSEKLDEMDGFAMKTNCILNEMKQRVEDLVEETSRQRQRAAENEQELTRVKQDFESLKSYVSSLISVRETLVSSEKQFQTIERLFERLVVKTTQLESEKVQKEAQVQKLMDENMKLSALLDKKEAQLLAMNEQCKVMALSASNI